MSSSNSENRRSKRCRGHSQTPQKTATPPTTQTSYPPDTHHRAECQGEIDRQAEFVGERGHGLPEASRFYTASPVVPLVLTGRSSASNKTRLELFAREERLRGIDWASRPPSNFVPCTSNCCSRLRIPRRNSICIIALLGQWRSWPQQL